MERESEQILLAPYWALHLHILIQPTKGACVKALFDRQGKLHRCKALSSRVVNRAKVRTSSDFKAVCQILSDVSQREGGSKEGWRDLP